ncbi:MAG: glutamine synthetase [Bacteroidetes bacterium GWC2_33_15]|nr:MAG: glutamine synthetase [Bacteroidetes bacterium GWA2_33_15]OFX50084.1 MAG: glutamine synthetase [Bacteroidetes bacterium GWC2_33_15]OFX65237.1 MAG: glutamine synthetase [Bacteroidetes bacterium GWB2_32_14]OFX70463.1 MAG: glutamine synthetase [Bacteroidetes bacterium GWD2_33_33]HAN19664.1 glutamine synthetase type III [Bacteroidales bacterium]
MATVRLKALEEVLNRKPVDVELPSVKTSEYFGINVFDKNKMQEYLSREAYESVVQAINQGVRIDRKVANQVASGMKAWAIDRRATHYTHWFHPLSGSTAEKHDAFFEPADNGGVIENFQGEMLVQQEPDASSFPSGGLRNTFEARGYTAWDPSSPAFVYGNTLCIPTIFVSYTGEALDYKTPLLKSLNFIDKAAVDVCQLFEKEVSKVNVTLGWEQEYFLIDNALYNARPDLYLTGRTLIGHASAKDQQLSDHYFGSISDRVTYFMRDFEIESYKLGIPIKTRHNEVAPNQFECAPRYEEANLAADHNQMLMTIMEKVAKKHNFRVLFHEKPYKGINGSGKHNNWSMLTDTGRNLLSPGKTPKSNLQFLTFLINTIKAVHDHADLLRASIATAGNEYRLGAHEAPPAIMSVFIGSQLTSILDQLEKRVTNKKMTPDEKTELKLDIGKIPEILMDNTDRNRTSPFAFTGNRFEFRAVGSSANVAAPMIALNSVVGNQLVQFKKDVDVLMQKNVKKDEAIFQVLKKYIIESKKIRFEGNGYSNDWVKEAEKRGLSNVSNIPDALKEFITPETIKLFGDSQVLSERELEARYDIRLEIYVKRAQIEARVLGDLARNHVIPTVIKYQNVLIQNVMGLKELYPKELFEKLSKTQLDTITTISEHMTIVKDLVELMIEARKRANEIEDIVLKATDYSRNVVAYFDKIRYHVDKLELIVDDSIWPFPKYREMLFTR